MNEEDREAGLMLVLEFLGELVSKGGSFSGLVPCALLFLQALITFCLLIASTEFFLSMRGFNFKSLWLFVFLLLYCDFSLVPDLGECGGVQLRHERDDLPLDTALSLSESSVFITWKPSSEFFFPMGGFDADCV